MRVRLALSALVLALAACDRAAAPVPPRTTRDLTGCWSLDVGPWSGPLPTIDSAAYRVPEHVALAQDRLPAPPGRVGDLRLLPARAAEDSGPAAYWKPGDGEGTADLLWSLNGFVGVAVELRAHGDSVVGVAYTFHDFHPVGGLPDVEAPVVATPAPCRFDTAHAR
jgi:hypothetical protein